MPIYRATLKGRSKTVLIKADSAAQARDQLVSTTALTATDMAEAIDSGERVWKPDMPLPGDNEVLSDAGFTPEQEDRIADIAREVVRTGAAEPEAEAPEAEEEPAGGKPGGKGSAAGKTE